MKRIAWLIPALLVPSLTLAQTPTPNSQASDIAKAKVAATMARRATRVRGEAVGLDNLPVTPAQSATPATHATPHPGDGPATPATPATPAVPASPSHRPAHAGQGGQGRSNNPRRP